MRKRGRKSVVRVDGRMTRTPTFHATLVGRQMVEETLLATVDEGGMKCSVREMQLLFPGSPSRDLL